MEEKPRIHSKLDMIKAIIFFIIVAFVVFVFAKYLINNDFRNAVDTKILRKELRENMSNIIEINSDDDPYISAFDKYITLLSKNVLTFYNQDAIVESKLDVNITTPYTASNDKYLVLAEKNGNRLYLIYNTNLKWEKEIDGEIYRVNINKNGYVSVLLKNATYKSIVVVYDSEGNELFRTYLATSYAVCSEISNDNKYLAIGQIDYSSTIVKSIVKMISIDSVKEKSQNSVVYTYESESNKVLSNIKFNTKDEAICMFDSYVQKVTLLSDERLYDIKNESIFVDLNLESDIVAVEKETSGLFSYEYQVNIKSTIGKSDKLYILENDIPKRLKINKNLICLNLASEVRIVNSNGWLLKRYTTNSEIQDIVMRR